MKSTHAPVRRRVSLAAAVVAASVGLVTAGATGASAAVDRGVTGGDLTWGVKASFRSYMTGFIAHGTITPSNGAKKDAQNVITFTGGNGALTADGTTHFAYKGAAHYYGHEGELDFTLSDPYLSVDKSGTGSLYMNYAVGKGAPKQVKIATVRGAAPAVSGDIATVANASTALTDAGVEVFSYKGNGFYPAGTALDPVTAKANLAPATKPTTPPTTKPTTPTPSTTAPSTPAPTTPAPSTSAPTTPAPSTSAPTQPSATSTTPAPTSTAPTSPAPTAPASTSTTPTTPSGDATAPAPSESSSSTAPEGPVTGPVVQTDLV